VGTDDRSGDDGHEAVLFAGDAGKLDAGPE
jgi:hypothetical protein